jgi:hypothetical protein
LKTTFKEKAMETTIENAELVKLPVKEPDGRSSTLRFSGVHVTTTLARALLKYEIYCSTDGRVVAYDADRQDYVEMYDLEELREWAGWDVYIKVMNTLASPLR